jgi:hypothetical protein
MIACVGIILLAASFVSVSRKFNMGPIINPVTLPLYPISISTIVTDVRSMVGSSMEKYPNRPSVRHVIPGISIKTLQQQSTAVNDVRLEQHELALQRIDFVA